MSKATSIYDIPNAAEEARMAAVKGLIETGAFFHANRWSYATSSNYSVVLSRDPLRIVITASGRDKSKLGPGDFTIVDESGQTIETVMPKPSAETLLHVVAAREAGAGAILHTHSVWGTLLSDVYFEQKGFALKGYEMLKGFDGIATHDTSKWVEIFDNTQNIPELAHIIGERLRDADNPLKHGYLIRGHGLYTWGRDLAEARRQVETFEFLFEVIGRKLSMRA